MGRNQPFRGDPESKLYYLVSNFSGGVNTATNDELLADYEFRELLNTEIGKQGVIQNRKGFGEVQILTELFEFYNINGDTDRLPTTGTYSLVRIIANEGQVLESILDGVGLQYQWLPSTAGYWATYGTLNGQYDIYDDSELPIPPTKDIAARIVTVEGETTTYEYFRSFYYFPNGLLKILMVVDNEVYLLTYNEAEATDKLTFEQILVGSGTLPAVDSYNQNLLGAKVVEHIDHLYVSLSDISPYYKGILVYDRDTDTWTTWRGAYKTGGVWVEFATEGSGYTFLDTPVYKPTPYELTSNGYNALAASPVDWVSTQNTGLKQLRDILIFDTSGNWLEKIPSGSPFVVRVYYTGTGFHPAEVEMKMYRREYTAVIDGNSVIQHDDEVAYVLTAVSQSEGYFEYTVGSADFSGANYVYIEFSKQVFVDAADITLATASLLSPFQALTATKLYTIGSKLYRKTNYGYSISDYTLIGQFYGQYLVPSGSVYSASFGTVFSAYRLPQYHNQHFEMYDTSGYRRYAKYNYGTDTFDEPYSSDIENPPVMGRFTNFDTVVPNLVDIIKVTTPESYYARVDSDGDAADFESIDYDAEEIIPTVTSYFDVVAGVETKEINGIDLEGVHLVEIDNKLVMFKGNTIWFSNIYQFDYFPNFAVYLAPILSTDEITNISYFRGSWIVFTKERIFKMKGTFGSSDWSVTELNNFIGCIAPDSVKPVENTLYFLSNNGLYRLTQNYYLEGLENVQKVDKNTPDLIDVDHRVKSIIYNDQLIYYLPENDNYDAVRMYHNIDLPNKLHPFVTDSFAVKPTNLFGTNAHLLSVANGIIYAYDRGYTDFYPHGTGDVADYLYTTRISTSRNSLGLPTHDKKFKAIYLKVQTAVTLSLVLTVEVNDYTVIDPYHAIAELNDAGEIEYTYTAEPTELGNFELGYDPLGAVIQHVHKINVGQKGKTITLTIEQTYNAPLLVVNIGYLYKVGKIRENS